MNIAPFSPPKILLVDDNRDGLLVRKALLEESGYQVSLAADGEEGLKLFRNAHFDVVITDLKMPVMGGLELISRIRAANPDARVILLSGFVDPLGLNEENTGANAVIPKNFNEANRLLRSIRRLVNAGPARKPPAPQRNGSRSRVARAR